MTSKKKQVSRLIILDADVIIHLHELQMWGTFVDQYNVLVASIVAEIEVLFYTIIVNGQEKQIPIDLEDDARKGLIRIVSADLAAFSDVGTTLFEQGAPQIDDGESETIAFVLSDVMPDLNICLIDGSAIICAVMLGLKDACISVEGALNACGLGRSLPDALSTTRFQRFVKEGEIKRVQSIL